MRKRRNYLEFYGFRESNGFIPLHVPKQPASGVFVTISKEDGNIITIGKDGGILAKLSLDIEGNNLSLVNMATGFKLSTVEIPHINAVTDLSFEQSNNVLYLLVTKNDGLPPQRIEVPLGNVIKAYTAGPGVNISDDNEISVKLAEAGGIKFYEEEGNAIGIDDDYVASQDEIDDTNEKIDELEDKLSGITDDLKEIDDDIDTIFSSITDIADSLLDAQSGITELDERVDNIEDIVEGLTPQGFEELEEKVEDLSAVTTAMSNAIDSIIDDIEEISATCGNNASEIERLDNEKLDATAYTPYDDSELREKIAGKLDATAYTPYDDTEIRSELDGKLDITAYTPYDDTELVASINGLKESKLDASAYTPTDLSNYYNKEDVDEKLALKVDTATLVNYYTINDTYSAVEVNTLLDAKADASALTEVEQSLGDYVTINTFEQDQQRQDDAIAGKATIGQLQDLQDQVNSMPSAADLDAMNTAIENKADATALTEVQDAMENFVTYDVYSTGQGEQDAAINNKADKATVTELHDKLNALVDLNNITKNQEEAGWSYNPPQSLAEAIKVIDHLYYIVHSMEKELTVNGSSIPFEENTCDSLLTKVMVLLDGMSGDDIDAINGKLKEMIE